MDSDSTSVLEALISAVENRCKRLDIDLGSRVDLSKYKKNNQWYAVFDSFVVSYTDVHDLLEFCTKLDKRVDRFIYNEEKVPEVDEQAVYMNILTDYTNSRCKEWLQSYIDKYCTQYRMADDIPVRKLIHINYTSKIYLTTDGTIVRKQYIEDNFTILHEYIVGLQINRLMDEYDISSFMRTVGYCGESLYLEYIRGGNTLRSILSELDKRQIESCILQILFSIYHAFCTIGFIHRDLSVNNILVIQYNRSIEIAVLVPDSEGLFSSCALATDVEIKIIDYGHSSVQLSNIPDFRLVSFISQHQLYEQTDEDISGVSPANDIMYFVSTLLNSDHFEWKSYLLDPIIRMIYRLYTNTVLEYPSDEQIYKFMPDVRNYNDRIHLTSPLLGPLYVKEAILQYYSDCT